MRILAHFKNHRVLRRRDIKPLAQGSYLRDDAIDELIEIIHGRNLLKGRVDGQKWTAGRNLYKDVSF